MKQHKVYIVGAGPGDAELLTVKAKKLLIEYADVVVHDRLISKEILKLIPKKVEKIFAGKEPELHHMKQEDINDVLVKKARAGKKVVRLKGGDPFIFGRGGEEAEYLRKHKLSFEVVPGITTAMGAAAESVIPLTFRGGRWCNIHFRPQLRR
jgi:uroporphyrin-III C-methyltransferase